MSKASWIIAAAAAALVAAAPAAAQRGHGGGQVSGGSGFHHGGGGHLGGPGHGGSGPVARNFDRSRIPCRNLNGACNFEPVVGLGYYGGGLIEDPYYAAHDQGYFTGPADVHQENGAAYYDYDRGYPYDWYHDSSAAAEPAPAVPPVSMVRCAVTWTAEPGAAPAPIRVCRGH